MAIAIPGPARWTHRQRVGLGLVVTLLSVTVPFTELFLGARTGMYNDITGTHLPRYVAAWQNIRQGESPFWWSTILSGHNTLGAGQSAIFYLPTAVFGWMSPIPGLRLWLLFHLWAMAAGWFVWAKRRWQSIPGAVIVGIVGTLNGTLVSHFIDLPYIACLALLPWALVSYDYLVERRRNRYAVLFALAIAGIALNGLPQVLWIILLGFGIYSVVGALARVIPWKELIRHAVAIGLGAALSAAALLPQSKFSNTSLRPRLTKQGAFEFAEEPRHFLTLIAPNIMGGAKGSLWWTTGWLGGSQQPEQINYLGVVALALAVIGIVQLRGDRRIWGLLVAALFGILAALGGATPFGSFVYHVIPFADRFRIWSRDLLLLNIAITGLAGAGAREILRMPRRWLGPVVLATAALGVFMTALPAATSLGGALLTGTEGVAARWMPIALLLCLAGAVWSVRRHRRAGAVTLIIVCFLDMGSFAVAGLWRSQGASRTEAQRIWGPDAPFFGQPTDMPDGIDRWVSDVADSSTLWPSSLPGAGPTVNGYDPLIQREYATSLGTMSWTGYLNQPLVWSGGWMPDVLRTTTLLASGYAGAPAPGWNAYGTFDIYTLYSYSPRLAESYLVGDVRIGSLDEARAALMDSGTDLTQYAYVDRGTVDTSLDRFAAISRPGASGAVISGAMGDGGSGTWTVFAERPSLFITSYAWMEGWHATVDGKPVPVARTNALVLGVPIPAGAHRVTLTFTPPGWTAGRNISILALVIVVGLFLSDISRQRWARLARSVRTAGKREGATGAEPVRGGVKVFTDRAD